MMKEDAAEINGVLEMEIVAAPNAAPAPAPAKPPAAVVTYKFACFIGDIEVGSVQCKSNATWVEFVKLASDAHLAPDSSKLEWIKYDDTFGPQQENDIACRSQEDWEDLLIMMEEDAAEINGELEIELCGPALKYKGGPAAPAAAPAAKPAAVPAAAAPAAAAPEAAQAAAPPAAAPAAAAPAAPAAPAIQPATLAALYARKGELLAACAAADAGASGLIPAAAVADTVAQLTGCGPEEAALVVAACPDGAPGAVHYLSLAARLLILSEDERALLARLAPAPSAPSAGVVPVDLPRLLRAGAEHEAAAVVAMGADALLAACRAAEGASAAGGAGLLTAAELHAVLAAAGVALPPAAVPELAAAAGALRSGAGASAAVDFAALCAAAAVVHPWEAAEVARGAEERVQAARRAVIAHRAAAAAALAASNTPQALCACLAGAGVGAEDAELAAADVGAGDAAAYVAGLGFADAARGAGPLDELAPALLAHRDALLAACAAADAAGAGELGAAPFADAMRAAGVPPPPPLPY
jgi:hypothetical protein